MWDSVKGFTEFQIDKGHHCYLPECFVFATGMAVACEAKGLFAYYKIARTPCTFILNYGSTNVIDCMQLQPAIQQLLHEPSLEEGNLREMGELDAERWELV